MANSANPGKRLSPVASVHTRLFDSELVVLDLARGEYLALDAIGSMLWRGLEAGKNPSDIAEEVAAEYDVEPAEALADLEALRDDLVARGLFVEIDMP